MSAPVSRRALLRATIAGGVLACSGRVRGAVPASIGVVGGGILGASIAMHLAEAGARVTLFERKAPASGATMNSFAWVNAFSDDAHYRDLRIESLLAYRELDQRLKLELVWGGYLDWAKDAADLEALHANAAMLAHSRFAMQRVLAAEIARLDPKLRSGPVAEAFYSKIDAHLDPVFVTQRYLDQAAAHGAEIIYPCEVRGIDLERGRLAGIRTTRGAFRLQRLVVAAGVDTPTLLAMAGFPLRLKHAPGILAHSVALPAATRLVHDAPGGLSFKQMTNGASWRPMHPARPTSPRTRASATTSWRCRRRSSPCTAHASWPRWLAFCRRRAVWRSNA